MLAEYSLRNSEELEGPQKCQKCGSCPPEGSHLPNLPSLSFTKCSATISLAAPTSSQRSAESKLWFFQ